MGLEYVDVGLTHFVVTNLGVEIIIKQPKEHFIGWQVRSGPKSVVMVNINY
jgi:hypothetical protein